MNINIFLAIALFAIALTLIVWGFVKLEQYNGFVTYALNRYKTHLAAENANFRKLCVARHQNELLEQGQLGFFLVTGLVYQALCDCADTIGAVVPPDISSLADAPHLAIFEEKFIKFRLRFRIRRGFGQTARSLQRNLQMELDRGCYHHGVEPLIVHVTLTPDNVAMVSVAWKADLLEAHRKRVKL